MKEERVRIEGIGGGGRGVECIEREEVEECVGGGGGKASK